MYDEEGGVEPTLGSTKKLAYFHIFKYLIFKILCYSTLQSVCVDISRKKVL